MSIPVVENPRKRRKRRTYSAKQRRYGFGGGRKRKTTTRRRRRNPVMASLAANPRRRRRSSPKRRYYPRRRNPGFMGLGGGLVMNAVMVGAGALGSEMVPRLVRKFLWAGLPSTGIMGYGVKLGGTIATATVVKMVTKSQQNFNLVMAGGLGLIFVDLFREYVAPRVGLGGMGYNEGMVYAGELEDIAGYGNFGAQGVEGYVSSGMNGAPNPPGGF